MNDTDKLIFKELRELRKSVDNNFFIVHQKIDKNAEKTDDKIGKLSTSVDGYKTGFLVFKAKFAFVGVFFVAVGQAFPHIVKFFKE